MSVMPLGSGSIRAASCIKNTAASDDQHNHPLIAFPSYVCVAVYKIAGRCGSIDLNESRDESIAIVYMFGRLRSKGMHRLTCFLAG